MDGHCKAGEFCLCGGDTYRVRSTCPSWVAAQPKPPAIAHYKITVEEQVWLEAWTNTARADNCTEPRFATTWADKCLADFKERFRK